ncbi:MAG: hypothetical protein RLZZ171_1556 [Cyanobacteriota bacterium]
MANILGTPANDFLEGTVGKDTEILNPDGIVIGLLVDIADTAITAADFV